VFHGGVESVSDLVVVLAGGDVIVQGLSLAGVVTEIPLTRPADKSVAVERGG
jgi:hypothetical protein